MRKDILDEASKKAILQSEIRTLVVAGILTIVIIGLLLSLHSWKADDRANDAAEVTVHLPDFTQYKDVKEKKTAFFDYMRPIVEQQNLKIKYTRAFLEEIKNQTSVDLEHNAAVIKKLRRLAKSYEVSATKPEQIIKRLMVKIDTLPVSLVLVQAANESAWGTSRFAREANNLFGQWCFTPGCGLVPKGRSEGDRHEVRKFDTPSASVASYMKNLNSHPAYKNLRAKRAQIKLAGGVVSGVALAEELGSYSERKDEYINELVSMIRQNDLE